MVEFGLVSCFICFRLDFILFGFSFIYVVRVFGEFVLVLGYSVN